ncbi:MAG: T9SS type A sorting domain-containing protein [Saprospiraceae bacterium]
MKQLSLFLLSFFSLSLSAQNRYLEPFFDQITVTKNIQYGVNATVIAASQLGEAIPQSLMLDLYEPTGDTASARPMVLVLPGGFYLPNSLNGTCDGSKNDSAVVEICTRLAKMGYVAVAVDYRLGWNPVSPQQVIRMLTYVQAMYRGIQDSRTAIRFFKKTVVEDANPFRVDTSRIVLWGESMGGQIALGAAYANSPNDWVDPSLIIFPPNVPAILPPYIGNIWGTDVGVLDAAGQALYGLPEGDTLCYPNWPGYSSDFQLCVSMAGFLIGIPWVGPGEMPAVLFHAPNDAVQPCGDGLLNVGPPLNLGIIAASGSCSIAAQLDLLGNNQVFWDADINDCVSNNANTLNGGLEGFYPFVGLPSGKGRPWEWTAPCANNPSGPTDGAFARQYLDTVFAYFAPRACAALALCNAQPDPNGLCGTQAKGKAFLDINQNGSLDAGELPFPSAVIELQPGGFHASSGSTGNFSISVVPGNYTLDVPNPPNYYAPTNTPISVTVPVGADVFQNIGLHPTVTANDLQVSLTPFAAAKPGFFNILSVSWKNVGTTQLSGSVTLTADPNYFISGSTPPANISGNVATWTFANLPPLQGRSAWLQVFLLSDVPLGTQLTSIATIEPTGVADETPTDNLSSIVQTVVGSFDPNDKQVWPSGNVTSEILEANGGWLDYTVRFQNTGTASADNVYIVDTLSELLNISSLEIVGTSHPMRWEIGGQRTLTWFFDNILLPDSLHNEPASHGFVRYRIRPTLPFGGLLNKTASNFADIYFDFNAPVRTNTVETKFTEESGSNAPLAIALVQIAPNPVGDFAILSWSEMESNEPSTLRVLDAAGNAVFVKEILEPNGVSHEKIAVKNWPKGLYFVQFQSKTRTISGRFVKG